MRKTRSSLVAVVFVLISVTAAGAVPVTFDLVGVNDPNNTATVIFAYNPSTATISLDITNTAALWEPILTGFAFNAPSEVSGVSSFTSIPVGWTYEFEPNAIDTPGQFGFFDVAGLTGTNLNGGFPPLGIPAGETYTFTFGLLGTDLATLDEMSFLGLYSYLSHESGDPQYFIARFQNTGIDGGGSDEAIPGPPVPEPGTMLLLGSGLVGLGAWRRRRKTV